MSKIKVFLDFALVNDVYKKEEYNNSDTGDRIDNDIREDDNDLIKFWGFILMDRSI